MRRGARGGQSFFLFKYPIAASSRLPTVEVKNKTDGNRYIYLFLRVFELAPGSWQQKPVYRLYGGRNSSCTGPTSLSTGSTEAEILVVPARPPLSSGSTEAEILVVPARPPLGGGQLIMLRWERSRRGGGEFSCVGSLKMTRPPLTRKQSVQEPILMSFLKVERRL